MVDFGVTDEGHPDEVVLPGSHGTSSMEKSQTMPTTNNAPRQMQPPPRPVVQSPRPPQTPNQQPQRPGTSFQGRPQNPQPYSRPPSHTNNAVQQAAASNRVNTPPPNHVATPEQVSFFSARSIKKLPEDAPPDPAIIAAQGVKPFDPRLESPSIRKTPGIDHNSSKPVSRTGQHVPPVKRDQEPQRAPGVPGAPGAAPASNSFSSGVGLPPGRPNVGGVGNPALNNVRQIGAPGGPGSPLANRGQYRPLTVKRPAPGPDPGNRPPLTEVSTNGAAQATGGAGTDPKRQKVS